jgi:hypothetical protein
MFAKISPTLPRKRCARSPAGPNTVIPAQVGKQSGDAFSKALVNPKPSLLATSAEISVLSFSSR